MGFWSGLFGTLPSLPVVSQLAEPNDLVQLTVKNMIGDGEVAGVVTRDIAMRVPAVKRAYSVHCGLVAGIPFRQQTNGVFDADQPEWLYRSASPLMSPYLRWFGVTGDLFFHGCAVIGAELGPDNLPVDGIHIPFGLWTVDRATGEITIDESIDAKYRQLAIAIPLGMNGILTDGADTIRAARAIEAAHSDRIENPVAQTELHLTEAVDMTRKEKLKMAADYNAGRKLKGGSTSVTPHNVEVKIHGEASADLFESGRNAIRLDIANHALVPASIIEGAKSGSGGDINYSNDSGKRNELYDFGSSLFVQAIEARLSADDVCAPGKTTRGDLTYLMSVPTPNQSPASED